MLTKATAGIGWSTYLQPGSTAVVFLFHPTAISVDHPNMTDTVSTNASFTKYKRIQRCKLFH